METNNKNYIMVCDATKELFDCKKQLDTLFDNVSKSKNKIFGNNNDIEDKVINAYVIFNDVIMDLICEQIDTNSTETDYKMI